MNRYRPSGFESFVFFVGLFVAFSMAGVVAYLCRAELQTPSLGEERGAIRRKNLADWKTNQPALLNNYGWHDQTRGLVHLPMEQAMQLTINEWKTPALGRSNLIKRAEKAVPAAPVPGKNPYE